MDFTLDQLKAINAPANVLVMAGAGTGKTRTLVEHCVRQLLENEISIDQVLMLTFTEAAAAEMRERIGLRLQEKLNNDPSNPAVHEQIALLGTARISTLHSYCYRIIREFFDQLGLDPGTTVLTQQQAKALQMESFDELRDRYYAEDTPLAAEVRGFIESQAASGDKKLRSIVEAIHTFTQARPQPRAWVEQQLKLHQSAEPSNWSKWLWEGLRDWAEFWLDCLRCEPAYNTNARGCAEILARLRNDPVEHGSTNWKEMLGQIIQWDNDWPPKKKGVCRAPMEKLFGEAKFFASLLPNDENDPLREDWEWSQETALTLLRVAAEFARIYETKKKAIAALDFSDLEQFALELLWDSTGQPSLSALEIATDLKWIYVDEYQDINPAQDRILRALHQPHLKLFMVGDVKQSIYRFRQAAPEIFQNYVKEWQTDPVKGSVVYLSANFRSSPEILEFTNRFFTQVMHEKIGGVVFDKNAQLTCGRIAPDAGSETEGFQSSQVEVLLQVKSKSDSHEPGENDERETEADDLSANEQEAVVVAERLRELRDTKYSVTDESGHMRPFEWGDAVILLRAPRGKVESYAKIFEKAGIPLQAKRVGFFSSIEVLDLTNILTLLDNPLQDVPLLSVLRSPLAGFTVTDLAEIRINAERDAMLWHALQKYHRGKKDSDHWRALDRFLERYNRWRDLSRHASLRERLQTIITETHYAEWLSIQPRGRQRLGNVEQLLAIAGEFDVIHRQGIYHFIRFIEEQQDAVGDIEPAGIEDQNAVRLMSIHQSKGLEFPVVVVADLGKKFNLQSGPSGVTLTDRFGFATPVRPPNKRRSYKSLPGWLAERTERAESIGEELRVLYVAMTRPKQKLILAASVSQKAADAWKEECAEPLAYHRIGRAGNAFDWIGRWLAQVRSNWTESVPDVSDGWYWQVRTEAPEAAEFHESGAKLNTGENLSLLDLPGLISRIEQQYPFASQISQRAKTSVSALRRQLAPDPDAEMKSFVPAPRPKFRTRVERKVTAAQTGAATHLLLERLDFASAGKNGWLDSEIERLVRNKLMCRDEAQAIDLGAIENFWASPVGLRFLSRRDHVRRELPFTLRRHCTEIWVGQAPRLSLAGASPGSSDSRTSGPLASLIGSSERPARRQTGQPWRLSYPESAASSSLEVSPVSQDSFSEDFIIVQGVIDLAMIDSREIWLLDFKTDRMERSELAERIASYRPQLEIYKSALEEIYKCPVTNTWLHFLSLAETVQL